MRETRTEESLGYLRPAKYTGKVAALMASLIFVAGIVIAVVLMSQTLTPSIAGTNPMTSNCAPSGSTVPFGSSGAQTFACSGGAAFGVSSQSVVTPSFSLPTTYTGLWVYSHGATTNNAACSAIVGAIPISSGTPVTLGSGSYDYCADYVNYNNPGAFDVTWNA
ncbi:MAG TPA: hypothetical protein VFA17_03250 [Thermoplasmata archaeon]|nr:hypothetical protein [Thermoplasmata archaeon]